MKVAHFCTFPHGGAAAAAMNQHRGLLAAGVESKFYYHRNQQAVQLDDSFEAIEFTPPAFGIFTGAVTRRIQKQRQRKIYDQFNRNLAIRETGQETFSMAQLPEPTKLDWQMIDADVVNMHWMSYFADYPSFFHSIPDHIPIVWTLHDTNAFTGGCHYNSGCTRFQHGCGGCPQVTNSSHNDVSQTSFSAKRKSLRKKTIDVIAPCDWMLNLARGSNIWPAKTSFNKISYGLDLKDYHPVDRLAARQSLGIAPKKTIVAFGAMDVENRRKGFQHLLPALSQLNADDAVKTDLECVAFGSGELATDLPMPKIHELGYVDSVEKKRAIYSAADIVVVPSLEDNQPQVGLEAMACGTPVVAFDACGLPEYVKHQSTGMLAEFNRVDDAKNAAALALSLKELILAPATTKQLGENAQAMVRERFEASMQTKAYQAIYQNAIAQQRLRRSA